MLCAQKADNILALQARHREEASHNELLRASAEAEIRTFTSEAGSEAAKQVLEAQSAKAYAFVRAAAEENAALLAAQQRAAEVEWKAAEAEATARERAEAFATESIRVATLSLEQDFAKRIAEVNSKAERALEEQVAILNKQSETNLAKAMTDAQTKFHEQMASVSEKAVKNADATGESHSGAGGGARWGPVAAFLSLIHI